MMATFLILLDSIIAGAKVAYLRASLQLFRSLSQFWNVPEVVRDGARPLPCSPKESIVHYPVLEILLSSDSERRMDSKGRKIMNSNRIDMGANRATFDQRKEFQDGCRRSFGLAFHLAVPVVADPSGQAQVASTIESEGAKPDSLDIAGNKEMHTAEVAGPTCGCNFAFHVEEI